MKREELVDLNAFLTVAQEHSFTHAAAKLGMQTVHYTAYAEFERQMRGRGLGWLLDA